jgi:hypothetical protein
MNTAAFHAFKPSAWMTQTGRAGSKFTWCVGNPACAKITQGTRFVIIKYAGGGFGGTMSLVVSAGANGTSLGIATAGGAIGFPKLAGTRSEPTGRGYADRSWRCGARVRSGACTSG